MPVALSVAIVTYRTPTALLEAALRSLAASAEAARAAGLLGALTVHVIDNTEGDGSPGTRRALTAWPASCGLLELNAGHGNLGYGRGNNLVLERLRSDLHLIMNPDVELAPESLAAALAAMRDHPEVGLLAPDVRGPDGERQYLCKRYPSVWVLFLRGFAPDALRRRHRARIERYEMRDAVGGRFLPGVPLASGCFMLVRTAFFREVGGFDPRYFMYFEDFDLSMRLARRTVLAYVPQVRIVHRGGEVSRKGLRHVAWFVESACRFFTRHGWKLA